jgi:hypothetical protein
MTLTPWSGKCQAAISLTFDDGLASQLAVAVPMLNDHSLQATFYPIAGEDYRQTLAPWKSVAETGHEIGNHTAHHPCSINHAFIRRDGRLTLEEMTVADMQAELDLAQLRLEEVIPTSAVCSFAYPCYQPFVGRGVERTSYVPLVAQRFVAVRGFGESANDPDCCDVAYLWSWPCERLSGADLIGLAERTAASGRWAIFAFHGIHEGNLSIAEEDLAELCGFLTDNGDRLWTAPVGTIAQSVTEWQRQIAQL